MRLTPPPSGSMNSRTGEREEGGTQGSPEHWPMGSEGQIAQGSMPVLRPVVFTNSAENASLSISVHKDFVCLGKKLIKAVTTQGPPGGDTSAITRGIQTQARQSLSGDTLRSLWQD